MKQFKTCHTCKKVKPANECLKRENTCLECNRAYAKRLWIKYSEQFKANARKYYHEHKEQCATTGRTYRQTLKGKEQQARRGYRQYHMHLTEARARGRLNYAVKVGKIYGIKKVNKEEGIKYLIPVLREVAKLDLPYEITQDEVIIKIPIFLPVNPK